MQITAIDPVPTCTISDISCPACNSQNITNGDNSNHQVFCGTYLTASHVALQPGDLTPLECITACDSTLECTGAHITDGGACSLAVGKIFGKIKLHGYTAFVAMADAPLAAVTSSVAGLSPPGVVVTVAASAGTVVSAGPPTLSAPYANNSYSASFTTHSSSGPGATGIVSPNPPDNNSSNLPPSYPRTGPMATGVVSPYPPQYNSSNLSPWYTNGPLNSTSATRPTAWNPNNPHPTPWSSNTTLPVPSYPNITHPTPYNLNSTNTTCSLSTFSCPACDGKVVTDLHNTQYSVLCNKRLLSTSRYALAEPLSVAYCLSQCDERNATCVGASWPSDDGCVLATGKINGTVSDPDSTAFIRFGLLPSYSTGTDRFTPVTTQPTWLDMSASPTGAFTSAPLPFTPSPLPYTTGPVTITHTSTLPSPPLETCNPAAITCPSCDGLRILDTQNTTYRLQCSFRPICDELVGAYGTASMNVCMNRCDDEEECVAAVYERGHCDLCQGGMDGEVDEDVGSLVLVPEAQDGDAGEETATLTSVSITTTATTAALSTPTSECDVAAMTCPECEGNWHTVANGSTYALDCDVSCEPDEYLLPRHPGETLTLDYCLTSCDKTAGCVAISYDPYTCGQCSSWSFDAPASSESSQLVYILRAAGGSVYSSAATPETPAPTGSTSFIAPAPFPMPWTVLSSASALAITPYSVLPAAWPSP
ncbi:hypothetical protein B0A48_09673 [Cryoendolithus antarcticus]|uniref:Apple domain-containing protein n=1 Tax=Cryoendolithus antarcticus TaxID=1507870 RepID=A0A1V8T094_9PEZI|nr:hypothetical protein B0A48_09673 [Cryoendolithus antarcticus]